MFWIRNFLNSINNLNIWKNIVLKYKHLNVPNIIIRITVLFKNKDAEEYAWYSVNVLNIFADIAWYKLAFYRGGFSMFIDIFVIYFYSVFWLQGNKVALKTLKRSRLELTRPRLLELKRVCKKLNSILKCVCMCILAIYNTYYIIWIFECLMFIYAWRDPHGV